MKPSMFANKLLFLVLSALVLGGCKRNDDPAPSFDAGADTADVGADTLADASFDAGVGEDATVDVAADAEPDRGPAPPPYEPEVATIQVSMQPGRAVYPTSLQLSVSAAVFSERGVSMPDVEVEWAVDPEDAAAYDVETDRWRLDVEGPVRFEACAGAVCGDRSIVVDDASPSVTLTSPEPGAELVAADSPVIVVAGVVADATVESGEPPRIYVAGTQVDVAEDGSFSTTLPPRFGVNHIEVVATDGLNPLETVIGADVLWAPAYARTDGLPPADEPEEGEPGEGEPGEGEPGEGEGEEPAVAQAIVPDALAVRLNQRFLDDGIPLELLPEESNVITEDLAGIVELLIAEADVMSLVPNPLADSDSLTLTIDSLALGGAFVELSVVGTGLEFYIEIGEVYVATTGGLTVGESSLDLTGGIAAVIAATAQIDVSKETREDELAVTVSNFDIALVEATPVFATEEANAVFLLAEGALFGLVEDLLVDTVAGSLLDEVPLLVEDLLNSLDESLGGEPFTLDLLGDPVQIQVNGDLATAQVELGRALGLRIDVALTTDQTEGHPDSRGIAQVTERPDPPLLFDAPRASFALRMSLLNGALHSLWNAGALEIDATSEIPDVLTFLVDSALLSAKLPPVLVAADPDQSSFPLVLQLGQMEAVIGGGGQFDRLGVFIQAGVDLSVEGTVLTLNIENPPQIRIWLIEAGSDEPIFANPAELESLITTSLWPLLAADLASGLAFDLPAFAVSLDELAPRLDDFELSFVLDGPVDPRTDWLVLEGAVEGRADLSIADPEPEP